MNKEQIIDWLNTHEIVRYRINEDLTVDVEGDVLLTYINLESIPIQFNKVNGDFTCMGNSLKTLKGSPFIVEGHYSCSENNQLVDLEGSPNIVKKNFICTNNSLKSLKGSPKEVGGNFFCFNNVELTSLEGISPIIGKFINCGNAPIESVDNLNSQFSEGFIHYGKPIENLKNLYEYENDKLTVRLSCSDFYNILHYNKLNKIIPNKLEQLNKNKI